MNKDKDNSRRNFLKNAGIASAITLSIPQLVSAAFAEEPNKKKIILKDNAVILFQGDSITDAGRKKTNEKFNDASALGGGYAMIATSELLHQYPAKNLKIYNRGISGDKVYQLAERWENDCLNMNPDVLSILVGVNNFWHKLLGRYDGTIKTYRDDYKVLLDRTKQKLPDVQLIIGEPYALIGISAVDEKWYPAYDEYRQAAREIANDFNAAFIPYQTIYEKALKSAPGVYWTADGVHPTLAGANLMAHAWLTAVKG